MPIIIKERHNSRVLISGGFNGGPLRAKDTHPWDQNNDLITPCKKFVALAVNKDKFSIQVNDVVFLD